MIIVSRSEQEGTSTLLVRGHAGYDEAGRDIVCAGVSALVFAYLAYLEDFIPAVPRPEVEGLPLPARQTPDGKERGKVTPDGEAPITPDVRRHLGNGMLEVTCRGVPEEASAWALVRTGVALLAEAYPDHVRLLGPFAKRGEADAYISKIRKEPKHEQAENKPDPAG